MANKSVLKSIRLSADLFAYIEKQPGNGFSNKFENLILSARDDEKRRLGEFERLNDEIKERREQLDKINAQVSGLNIHLQAIFRLDRMISDIKRQLDHLIDDS